MIAVALMLAIVLVISACTPSQKVIDSVYEYFLPSAKEQTRNIIVIKKVANTPDKYPREYKKILKTPL
jgi:hypothetical protein